jgi:hypothetical protein
MISIRALQSLFVDIDYVKTPEHEAASVAISTAVPFEEHLTEQQVAERVTLWRTHTEVVHAQVLAGMASLDKKAEEAFKFSASLVTALVAVTFAAQARLSAWFMLAMSFWLVAVFVFALMRRGMSVPGLPSAQKVRDRLFYPDSYDRWMTEVIHLLSVEVRLMCDVRSQQLNLGIAMLMVGLVFLAMHVASLYFRMTPAT